MLSESFFLLVCILFLPADPLLIDFLYLLIVVRGMDLHLGRVGINFCHPFQMISGFFSLPWRDLPSAVQTSARAGHDLDEMIRALSYLNLFHQILNIPETISRCKREEGFSLELDRRLFEIRVSYCLELDFLGQVDAEQIFGSIS